MKTSQLIRAAVVLALALVASGAQAVEMNGYFRDSTGFNSKGGSMACFQMPGTYFKARLGNECDRYLELDFSQTGTVKDTGDWRVEFMPASYLPTDGSGTNSLFIQQMWLGLKIPDLNGANIWAGRRYWKRHDVHSLDWFYWNPAQGNSAVGIEDVGLGFGKLAVTAIRIDASKSTNLLQGTYLVPDIRLYDIPVNPDGTLEVGVDIGVAHDQNKALGAGRASTSPLFTIQHNQANLLGGSNTLVFQYGSGAFARETGDGPGQLLAGGTTDDKQWRIIEHLVANFTNEFSSAFVVVYQDQSQPANAGVTGAKLITGEIRPSYQFNNWFKLSGDLFYQSLSLKGSSGIGDANLTKVTVAPTIVLGRGYYARPELRFFATYASWNTGATQIGTMAGGAFGTDKSGLNFGAQAEIWW
jgi:maltoporin